jgi:carbonic anhydrase
MSQHIPTAVTSDSGSGEANRFALTGGDQPRAGDFDTALERNRAFAAAGRHEGAVVFPKLRLLVVTCMDPRVDPAHFLGLQPSEAVVVRNGGGRVTPEVINDVAFISQIAENVIPEGPLFEVAVIHHTHCGSGALADETFRHKFAGRTGADEAELRDYAVLDPAATVTTDVERLLSAQAIPARVSVSGHVYDIVSGLVHTVVASGGYLRGNRQAAA